MPSGTTQPDIVWFQKISIPPPRMIFWCGPSHPPGISSFASYFPLKILAFETPLPLGIANDHPRGGYGNFMEAHIYL